jgi:hypothetical protein
VTGSPVVEAIARAHHEEWARVVAGLARRFGDLELAEEGSSEAYVAAAERWPGGGGPPSPDGWLTRLQRGLPGRRWGRFAPVDDRRVRVAGLWYPRAVLTAKVSVRGGCSHGPVAHGAGLVRDVL